MSKPFRGPRGYIDYCRLTAAQSGMSAITVLGRLLYARLLHGRGIKEFDMLGFSRRPTRDWKLYQPYEEVRVQQKRLARREFRPYEEDKLLFAAHCRTHGLPTPRPLALLCAPDLPESERERHGVPVLSSGDALTAALAPYETYDGFAKPVGGGQGWGAFGFAASQGAVTSTHGVETVDAFFTRITTSAFAGTGYLLQPRLRPHPDLAWGMLGQGVGTVRLVTGLRPDGSVTIVYALLFLVPPGAPTDKPRDGGFFAPIDLATGRIGVARGRRKGERLFTDIERMTPDGEHFVGRALPCWPETLALVERAARAFSMLPALGWDVAITPDGPTLVETNWEFGTSINMARKEVGAHSVFDALFAQLAAPRLPEVPAANVSPFGSAVRRDAPGTV